MDLGKTVLYQLDEADTAKINAWRSNFRAFNAGYAGHKHPHAPGTPGASGHVAHTGLEVNPGDVCAATVVAVAHSGEALLPRYNLKVHLNGNDDYWATSVPPGATPGTWRECT